ncbi:hypothetical protein DSO57_1004318 [Entomophthora muscae]|uniref:Uncharacterized protein n=1 Tax=Entomophthora muscae TaxID=34485 RepID=A0ACC2SLB5_9FUNG|nr:hypothetical protein DSO57_1004318 [Entomophthora muscae]
MKPDEPSLVPSTVPSHEAINQSNGPDPVNFPSPTQSKIPGTHSPVLNSYSPPPKAPLIKGCTTVVHQGASVKTAGSTCQ